MSWHVFSDSDSGWDQIIQSLVPHTPFQGSQWANFRAAEGWSPLRLVSANKQCAIQFLVKETRGLLLVGWAAGGPVGQLSPELAATLSQIFRHQFPRRLVYLRLSDFHESELTSLALYELAGWRRCLHQLSNGSTLIRNLIPGDESIRDLYSSNWSRNLRRGEQRGVRFEQWKAPDFVEMAHIYQEVIDLKQSFEADWRTSPVALEQFHSHFDTNLVLVRAVDAQNRTLSYRAAFVRNEFGYDMLAGTSLEGRKCYASHVATHGLLCTLAEQGCQTYDFGGVDKHSNLGVFNFKHGAGGYEHSYVGEFQTSFPRIVLALLERVMRFNQARRQAPQLAGSND
jgi:hypothetical protein